MRYTYSRSKLSAVLTGLIAVMAFEACALEGKVVEAASRKPVPGVFVIAGWEGQLALGAVQPHTKCIHSALVLTDEQGRFRLSAFPANMNPLIINRQFTIGIYKPGFREVSRSEDAKIFVVAARKSQTADEFGDIHGTYIPFGCGGNDRKLIPLLKALARELEPIAKTPKQREQVGSILFTLDAIESGDEVAFKNLRKRLQEESKRGERK
jgi:hypothetical protein